MMHPNNILDFLIRTSCAAEKRPAAKLPGRD
jgi:hypothetical protein